MDPITFLVLVGLAATGATVLAFFVVAVTYIAFAILLWTIAVGLVITGFIGDSIYERKVAQGKAIYRLPFYYRWKGWRLGSEPYDTGRWKRGMVYDARRKLIIGMYRPL